MTDTSLVAFKAIANFTKDLGDMYSATQHPLRLYCHLLNKTTLSHDKAIKKHIDTFRKFCIRNRDAILSKDEKKFNTDDDTSKPDVRSVKLMYSQNVYIDIDKIFSIADNETKQVIWKHLLVISALLDPTGNAKEILKANKGKEGDFLTDIISKVESHVNPDSNNPMEAISSIMSSGVFGEILSGMNNGLSDGSLDMTKLMTTVSTMVTGLSSAAGIENPDQTNAINTMMSSLMTTVNESKDDANPSGPPDISKMMGPLLSNLQKSMGEGGSGSGQQPDIASMLGPLLSSLSNAGGPNDSPPDLSKMLGPLLSSLGGGGGASNGDGTPNLMGLMSSLGSLGGEDTSIEEQIEAQVAIARKTGKISKKKKQSSSKVVEMD